MDPRGTVGSIYKGEDYTLVLTTHILQICLEMFRNVSNSDLVIFGSVSFCFETCPSENLEIF